MNQTLATWNRSSKEEALAAMLACCGATRWAEIMVQLRPIDTVVELSAAADRIWATPLRVARRLKKMLADPLIAKKAELVAKRLSHEDGVKTACDALEALYERTRKI
jgi:hypothetical protein